MDVMGEERMILPLGSKQKTEKSFTVCERLEEKY